MLEASLQKCGELVASLNPETGKPPAERLRDVKSAIELYNKLRQADLVSSQNRARTQAMFDGDPPYNQTELIADGQGHRCNLNFDEAAQLLESSMGGYVDLLNSVDRFLNVQLDRKKYPWSDQVYEWEQTISEEFTKALREWDKFTFNHLLLSNYFVAFGVGIAYFMDEDDWRWGVDSMANVWFPRETFATESELEVTCALRKYQAHQLYRKIANEEAATELGWNVEAVKRAIIKSCGKSGTSYYNNWEELQNEWKNNDLYIGYAKASEIRTVHFWVKEFDGKVSHYIALEQGQDNNEFLYKNRCRFEEMSEALVTFTYGIGTNGFYHGIRGLGYKIFPMIQVSNRARCQFMDGAMMSSSVWVQGKDEDSAESLQFQYFGPYAVISPGVTIIPQGNMNLSQNIVPVLNDMSSLLQNKTGEYQTSSALDPKEKTAFEVKADVSAKAKLSTTALNLFYEPWQRLLRQVLKRFCRRKYREQDPGGQLVWKFINRCVLRGVPLEAIYHVDADQTSVERAIGAGSPEMRLLILDEMAQLVPQYDDIGRYNYVRDRTATRVGYEKADRYIPAKPYSRVAPDVKIAELENAVMRMGQPQLVLPDEDHAAHARTHFPAMDQLIVQLQQQPDSIGQVVPPLALLIRHTTEHVASMSDSVLLQQEAAQFRKMLQNYSAIAENAALHLAKLEREQAKQQGQQASDAGETKLQVDIARTQAKIQMMQAESQAKMQIAQQESKQKLALRDAEAAAKILKS